MLTIRKALAILTLVALVCLLSQVAVAGGRCCARCGCASPVKRICRLVCTTKKITVTCWDCVCEEFCVPGMAGGCHGPGSCCQPACAHLYTRKKLMKREIVKEVPSYKWVVVDASECDCHGGADQVKPAPPTARLGDEYELTAEEARRRIGQAASETKATSASSLVRFLLGGSEKKREVTTTKCPQAPENRPPNI